MKIKIIDQIWNNEMKMMVHLKQKHKDIDQNFINIKYR